MSTYVRRHRAKAPAAITARVPAERAADLELLFASGAGICRGESVLVVGFVVSEFAGRRLRRVPVASELVPSSVWSEVADLVVGASEVVAGVDAVR